MLRSNATSPVVFTAFTMTVGVSVPVLVGAFCDVVDDGEEVKEGVEELVVLLCGS